MGSVPKGGSVYETGDVPWMTRNVGGPPVQQSDLVPPTENDWWRYYEAFNAIYDRVRRKYPDVILQQCAAGGGRNELNVISRFHEPYLTDGLWQPHVLQNFCGQTLAFPPENIEAIRATGARSSVRSASPRPASVSASSRLISA